MKDHPDDSRKIPPGKTRAYHHAAALGRRRMAKMNKRELREHQRRAARARWGPPKEETEAP